MVVSVDSESLVSTINMLHSSNTQVTTEVDLTGQSGGADVDPVRVEWGKLLSLTGLDVIGPLGNLDQVVLLEVFGISTDKVLSGHIFNCEEGLFSVHQKDLLRI